MMITDKEHADAWIAAANSRLAIKVREHMDANPRRKYHNWGHIEKCLFHAAYTLKLPYDDKLAQAILVHDVIYDGKGEHEDRSIEWALENGVTNEETLSHIRKTKDHNPSGDNRMILIDLADFMWVHPTIKNTEKVIEECVLLYGVDEKQVKQQNKKFLVELVSRLKTHSGNNDFETTMFKAIIIGIENAIERNDNE